MLNIQNGRNILNMSKHMIWIVDIHATIRSRLRYLETYVDTNIWFQTVLQQIALASGMGHNVVSSQQIYYACRLLGTVIGSDNVLRLVLCITSWILQAMMTSSNGNIFRVTGHLCGEFTGPRWIPHTKASDAELWCFLWSASEWTVE